MQQVLSTSEATKHSEKVKSDYTEGMCQAYQMGLTNFDANWVACKKHYGNAQQMIDSLFE